MTHTTLPEFPSFTEDKATEAVRDFNQRYGEMDRALWCISLGCRQQLSQDYADDVIAKLVWTVKSWWAVRGVESEVKVLMAQALTALDWPIELFEQDAGDNVEAVTFAVDRVEALVCHTVKLGARRREYSLASKVLHWLLPWRIPVYDGNVRKRLGIPASRNDSQAYQAIVQKEFKLAEQAKTWNTAWLGDVPPLSELRAIDKYLWWEGGGDAQRAVIVSNPWRIVDQLGLKRPAQ